MNYRKPGLFGWFSHNDHVNANTITEESSVYLEQIKKQAEIISEKDRQISELMRVFKINEQISRAELDSNIKSLDTVIDNVSRFGTEIKESITGLEQINAENREMVESVTWISENAEKLRKITTDQKLAYDNLIYVEEKISHGAKVNFDQLKLLVNEINMLNETKNILLSTTGEISNIVDTLGVVSINGSIQASHSGDHGKSFSVVMGEVKKLKDSSDRLLRSLKEKINGIINIVDSAVNSGKKMEVIIGDQTKSIDKAVLSLTELQELNDSIHNITEELANAVAQQRTGMEEVASTINQLVENLKKLDNYISTGEIFFVNKLLIGAKLFRKIGNESATLKEAAEKVLSGYAGISIVNGVTYAGNADAIFFDPSEDCGPLLLARTRKDKSVQLNSNIPVDDESEILLGILKTCLESIGVSWKKLKEGQYNEDYQFNYSRCLVYENITDYDPALKMNVKYGIGAKSLFTLIGMIPGGSVYCINFYSLIVRTQFMGDKVDAYVKTLTSEFWKFYHNGKLGW